MKNIFLSCFTLLLLYSSAQKSSAQISNNEINFEIRPYQLFYDGFNDVSSVGEVVYQTSFFMIPNFNEGWSEFDCYLFLCEQTPCTFTNQTPEIFYRWGSNYPFNTSFNFELKAMEDDNSTTCVFDDGDDDFYQAFPQLNFLTGQAEITKQGTRFPSQWYTNDNTLAGGWLFPNSSIWDLRLHTAYRFTAGDDCTNPLQFGTLGPNQSVFHRNSNRTEILEEHSGSTFLTYNSVGGQSSADVYYEFTLNQTLDVEISTDTDAFPSFDTYIALFSNDCATFIAEDDDIAGQTNQLSQINTSLPQGTYQVRVEGFSSNTGDFELSIRTSSSTLGVNNIYQDIILKMYPNPSNNFVTIELDDVFRHGAVLSVMDISGRLVHQENTAGSDKVVFPVHEFASGMYAVRIQNDEGFTTAKLIVE